MNDLFIRRVLVPDGLPEGSYLAGLPAIRQIAREGLDLQSPVTFFVGENGSGKSTLLEGIAVAFGFNPEGGSRNFRFSTFDSHSGLHRFLRLWKGARKLRDGYFLRAESFYNLASNIEQLDSTLDSYDDEQDDLDKTVSDWETQVRMIAEVLCMQATQYEKNITLLEDQITLAEKALNLAQVQQELGMALTTDVQSSQTSLEESRQSLETIKENLSDVKRQINVLIGRNQGSPLEIVPMSVPVIVSEIPAYSDALVKEITSKDYTLKTYERTIANYKDDVDGETDSDVLQAADNKIEAVKLNIEERERSIANNVKAQLAKMTTDKASYETSQTKVATEKKNLEVAQKKYDLGMLTASQLLQQEISYQSAVVTHWKNSYNYYLDWQEYKAMKEGIDISTYSSYRM